VLVGLALLTRVGWPWQAEFLLLTLGTYAVTAALYALALRTGPGVGLIGGRRPQPISRKTVPPSTAPTKPKPR
jgi:hypothetical protein